MSSERALSLMVFHRRKAHIFRRGCRSLWRNTTMPLRVEEHDDVVAIAPKSHQPFRTIDARSRAPRLLFSLARGRAGDGRNHDAGRD